MENKPTCHALCCHNINLAEHSFSFHEFPSEDGANEYQIKLHFCNEHSASGMKRLVEDVETIGIRRETPGSSAHWGARRALEKLTRVSAPKREPETLSAHQKLSGFYLAIGVSHATMSLPKRGFALAAKNRKLGGNKVSADRRFG